MVRFYLSSLVFKSEDITGTNIRRVYGPRVELLGLGQGLGLEGSRFGREPGAIGAHLGHLAELALGKCQSLGGG